MLKTAKERVVVYGLDAIGFPLPQKTPAVDDFEFEFRGFGDLWFVESR